jgi:nucleoside-diphosphate-sugar epimerase
MKILFLGGSGNISAECARLLHQRGNEIIVVSRGQTSFPSHYRSVRADRRNLPALRNAVKEIMPEVVINFLGFEPADLEIDFVTFGLEIRHYVFISSAAVYARRTHLPISESNPVGNPWWDYAQKKIRCEEWLQTQWKKSGYPMTIVRPSHTYSPRWFPNVVSSAGYTLAARLLAGQPVFVPDDGENPWTLTAASDFAVGLAGLIGREDALGETFHITSDEVLTWNQVYEETASALGVASPHILKISTDFICQHAPHMTGTLKGDKAQPGIFDNSKIKRFVPEFHCCKPFRAGIRECVEWFRQHPEEKKTNPEVNATFDQVVTALLARLH